MSSPSVRTKAYKHYPEPRLSALTLAHYCTARNAKERADIRQGARYLRVAGLTKNTDSRRALQRYLADLRRDRSALLKALDGLEIRAKSEFSSDFQQESALRNMENIRRFMKAEKELGLGNYGFELAPASQPNLVLADVPISVQIDCFVAAADDKDGQMRCGGAIIQLAKGGPLPEAAKRPDTKERRISDRAEINRLMAAMIYKHLAVNFADRGEPLREKCLIIDPFVPATYPVFGRLESQIRQMEEAATEISRLWASIKPPFDYDG